MATRVWLNANEETSRGAGVLKCASALALSESARLPSSRAAPVARVIRKRRSSAALQNAGAGSAGVHGWRSASPARGPAYARMSFTKCPCTSVRRRSRPWKRWVSFSWRKPRRGGDGNCLRFSRTRPLAHPSAAETEFRDTLPRPRRCANFGHERNVSAHAGKNLARNQSDGGGLEGQIPHPRK